MIINRLSISLNITLLLLPTLVFPQILPISEARLMPQGTAVTLRGIVANGGELGRIRYLQDGTAGIAAYPGSGSAPGFDATVKAGDSIEVSGTLVLFHGLLEISPVTAWQVISSGNPLPAAKPVALSDISDDLESQLISVECVTFDDAGGAFPGGMTTGIADGSGVSSEIYIPGSHPLENSIIPQNPVRLTAIVSEYDDFQLLIRSVNDLLPAPCLYFTEKPAQSDIQTTGFSISWKTSQLSSAILRYGTTSSPANEIILPIQTLYHEYVLSGLEPGTIYWIQVEALHNNETVLSETLPFATRALSSGQIKVYFNHAIDGSAAGGLSPDGQSFGEVLDETLARINAAEQSIDVAMYNNTRSDITAALQQAYEKGLRVRYVAALDASNTALTPPPAFPVVYGNASALMHNKFMVIDADIAGKCWVMSGSLNWTTGNMVFDFNNTLFIQDQSLARAYELEFEEMWGSGDLQPDTSKSRFGAAKKDNTPHQFIVGGIPVESWFSPSDRVTGRITEALQSADSEALFALLTFTKDEQADALADAFDGGAQVRGMIENTGDPGSEFDYLISRGVNVQQHGAPGSMHHKYGVVDAGQLASEPLVVTGSHNWTFAAETANDENTLIIHDADIATLFKAEFERRWTENTTAVHSPDIQYVTVFPNPASEVLNIRFDSQTGGMISIKDILGKTVLTSQAAGQGASRLNVGTLSAGFYFAVITTNHGIAGIPFQKI